MITSDTSPKLAITDIEFFKNQVDPNSEPANTYAESSKKHVHLLLVWGYEKAVARIQPDLSEEAITGFIAQSIQDLLNIATYPWFQYYAVHNEKPISNRDQAGKTRKKLDLTIEYVRQKGRPEFVFEAKQLNFNKSYQRTPNYLNEKGLKRFLSGEYAEYTARYGEVGMLGYVLSDTPACWKRRLKEKIENKSQELSVTQPQEDVTIIDAFPLEWTSTHKRESAPLDITIYHVLLDCC